MKYRQTNDLLNINGRVFRLGQFKDTNGTRVCLGTDFDSEVPYYIAEKSGIYAYSQTKESAVKHINHLAFVHEFEKRPLNLNEKIDIDTFVFLYRYFTFACGAVKENLIYDIKSRNIKLAKKYSLQQWFCIARNRYNFDYFIAWLAEITKTPVDNIHSHHDCNLCKKCFKIKCGMKFLGKAK